MTTTAGGKNELTEMAWDPITRIVGSLGIYTKIDFKAKRVAECHSTSSIFRGYSIFMKGKDPRDAHFITSRICGICGDNHATCSVYAQNMAYGVRPPHLGEWIINLGEAAEYMFDHNIFQENLVGVDYCEKMVAETNPGVLELANSTEAPHAAEHGYRTIGDIMRSLNPLEGEFYREALQVCRSTREMFCLMEGRHVHPSTLYPGGVGTVATVQLFTDYLTRLMRYVEFMKRVVPMHDDLFDFFYEALPGYEEVGRRRVLLGCWGSFNDPEHCDFSYRNMADWGRKMFVTPGVVVDGKLVTNSLVDINLGIRILLGHSFYEDWEDQEMFVTKDALGNPVDRRHPWNQHTIPRPAEARLRRQVQLDDVAALVRRQGPPGAGHRRRPDRPAVVHRAGRPGRHRLRQVHRAQRADQPAATVSRPEVTFEWKIPATSRPAAVQRDRAQPGPDLLPGLRGRLRAVLRRARRWPRSAPGRTKTWEPFNVPDEAISCGFTEAVRGVLSHHMVIRDGKIANYHPYPPTPWNGSVRDSLRHARPVRGRGAEHPDLRGEPAGATSRASTSCGRSAASTRACRAACTCTWATARCSKTAHSPTGVRWPCDADSRWREADGRSQGRARRRRARRGAARRTASASRAAGRRRRRGTGARCLVELYGAGLATIARDARADADAELRLLAALAADPLVASLLLLHDLHPLDADTRISARSNGCGRSSGRTRAGSSSSAWTIRASPGCG